ncbi:MAG: thymidine phosphorylase [Elusimicrobia bacterium GWC2_65_9]|nr:MAG: thymidine phosphorylase [Elusimicrobia bacterium GWA2_66_18]OGR75990.1 MAG: thymidine phosphorylase [Elusimicrobia bacterium GWC2_65_9]
MIFLDLIAKKRDGGRHTPEELAFVARGAARGLVPDYQLAAWLMAVVCRGMDERETVEFTRAMACSGRSLGLDGVARPKADKHSTGGVGDGVSLALAPLAAACGLAVPMMSGRGLGHTGGTLDKLESIKGFKVRLGLATIRRLVRTLGVCMFGQTGTLAPADRTLYALRDATATVPARPLIVGSILSKKVAEELDALVLDVKVGSGAIFRDAQSGRKLARALVKTSKGLGMPTVAVLTAMEQPLGRYVGNALEIRQALMILNGDETSADYLECLLTIGGWMLKLSGMAKTAGQGAAMMHERIKDRSGLRLFREMVKAQGGTTSVVDDPSLLPKAKRSRRILSTMDGYITRLDARRIGHAAVLLGAGRAYQEQELDYGAGLELIRKVGDHVKKGERIAVIHAADEAKLTLGEKKYREALKVGPNRPRQSPVVLEILK